mgnify:FL=1
MNKFSVTESIRVIKGTSVNLVVLYLANAICFALPVIVAITTIMLDTFHLSNVPRDVNQTMILQLPEHTSSSFQCELELHFPEIEYSSLSFNVSEIVYSDYRFGAVKPVIITDRNYKEFHGEDFRLELSHQAGAVIGWNSVNKLFPGMEPIGEALYFNNNRYQVLSITNNIHYSDKIVIIDPALLTENKLKPSFAGITHRLYLKLSDNINQENLRDEIAEFALQKGLMVGLQLGKELMLEKEALLKQYKGVLWPIGALATLFVLSNLGNVVSLLAEQDLIHIGIKLALGVSQLNVLAEMFIKYALVGLVSLVSTVIFVPYVVILLLRKANYFVEISVNLNDVLLLAASLLVLCLVFVLVEVYLVTKRYRNEDMDSLLRGGS